MLGCFNMLKKFTETNFISWSMWQFFCFQPQEQHAVLVQWRSQPKIYDFRRATIFCLGYRLSMHKMTSYAKIWVGPWPLGTPWLLLRFGIHQKFADNVVTGFVKAIAFNAYQHRNRDNVFLLRTKQFRQKMQQQLNLFACTWENCAIPATLCSKRFLF